MKREFGAIRMFDYSSKEEFEKHKKEMEATSHRLIENGKFNGLMEPKEIDDGDWKFTACYIKCDIS